MDNNKTIIQTQLPHYIDSLRVSHSPSTRRVYTVILRKFLHNYNESESLPSNYNHFLERTIMENSKNYAHLCGCCIRGYVEFLEMPTSTLPLPKSSKKRRQPITNKQLHSLLKQLENEENIPQYVVCALLAQTGLRVREFCNLLWKEVDLNQHTLIVSHGKGDKMRLVPLSESAVKTLNTQRDYLNKKGISSKWVYPNKKGEKISERMVQYHVRNAGEKIGIQLSPHRLRHTFANMCVDNGLDVSYLKEILGHESLATTEVYLHPTFDKIKGRFLEVMEE